MKIALLTAAAAVAWSAAAFAGQSADPASRARAACHGGVMHVALLSAAQLCPQPLATTAIRQHRPRALHT